VEKRGEKVIEGKGNRGEKRGEKGIEGRNRGERNRGKEGKGKKRGRWKEEKKVERKGKRKGKPGRESHEIKQNESKNQRKKINKKSNQRKKTNERKMGSRQLCRRFVNVRSAAEIFTAENEGWMVISADHAVHVQKKNSKKTYRCGQRSSLPLRNTFKVRK